MLYCESQAFDAEIAWQAPSADDLTPMSSTTSLLRSYCGAVPPAPAWFSRVLACHPKQQRMEVEGASIELLTWGPDRQAGTSISAWLRLAWLVVGVHRPFSGGSLPVDGLDLVRHG